MRAKFDYKPPSTSKLSIIHHDEDIIVVSKPSGLLSVPGKDPAHKDCLISRIQQSFPNALITHRLDMDTSGIIVLALNKTAQRHISRQFEQRSVSKIYHALVSGALHKPEGNIDLPLICDWPNRPLQKICFKSGKAAKTMWRVLDVRSDQTLIELKPITGRSHQLRVHMSALGHPILGDKFYAPKDVQRAYPRLALHSSRIELRHPSNNKLCVFEDIIDFS